MRFSETTFEGVSWCAVCREWHINDVLTGKRIFSELLLKYVWAHRLQPLVLCLNVDLISCGTVCNASEQLSFVLRILVANRTTFVKVVVCQAAWPFVDYPDWSHWCNTWFNVTWVLSEISRILFNCRATWVLNFKKTFYMLWNSTAYLYIIRKIYSEVTSLVRGLSYWLSTLSKHSYSDRSPFISSY